MMSDSGTACPRRRLAAGVTVIRAARRPSTSVTSSRKPSCSTWSPTLGSRPTAAITKPPTVSYGPVGQLQAGELGDLVQVQLAVDLDRAADQPLRSSSRRVVLVADVADDLLDEVLERDDAVGTAVLVDHDREMVAFAAHLRQRRQHVLRARQRLTSRARSPTVRPRSSPASPRIRSRMCTKPTTSS